MEKTEMKLNLEHANRYVRKFLMWVLNFDGSLRWIDEIWKDQGLSEHLKEKFKYFCETYTSTGGPVMFWASLDEDHQEELVKWVFENYTGTQL